MARKSDRQVQEQPRRRITPSNCPFCQQKIEPDYKDWQILEKFVSDRKKILNRTRSGVCARHQRHLSQAIKRARYLALLPFSVNI